MKIKLAVLFGGKSVEHDVSIISALQAIESLNKEKYEIIPVYITCDGLFYTGFECGQISEYADIPALLKKSTRCVFINEGDKVRLYRFPFKKFGKNEITDIDVAFPIVHGTNVEDGTLQGFLKTLNLPFVGCDVCASALGMDKYVMKTVLKDNGIPVLDGIRFYSNVFFDDPDYVIGCCEKKISYPVIVKPVNLGSSVGISVAHNAEQLTDSLDQAFRYADTVLVERAITNLTEINCSVLGDIFEAEASECEQPAKKDEILSFEDKYLSGGSGKKTGGSKGMASLQRKIPADISPERREEIRSLSVKAFQALGCCGVSRIDFMIDEDEDKVYFNEINTIPGSLSFYLWQPVGVPYSVLLDRMIELSLKRKRKEDSITFSFSSSLLKNFSSNSKNDKFGKTGGKF